MNIKSLPIFANLDIPVSTRIKVKEELVRFRRILNRYRSLPDFLIIGSQKCGTTSLYQNLIEHPAVVPSISKEIRFFDIRYKRGMSWYKAHFPLKFSKRISKKVYGGERLTGEASPSYIFSPHAPKRISEILPGVKLILMLRNPVKRAYSHYHHAVRYWDERLSFPDAVEEEENRLRGELEKLLENEDYYPLKRIRYSYLSRGRYAEQLENWFGYFPREQFFIINSEDYFSNPVKCFKETLNFLELPAWQPHRLRKYNEGKYPDMDASVESTLRQYFTAHNQRLYEMLGVDFGWEN